MANTDDPFTIFLDEVKRHGNPALVQMAAHEICAQQSHRYQVHGKNTPTKVSCSRCDATWAIGAQTEDHL
jgi:hypothetical protein